MGELDPHYCLVEGNETFVVAALCSGLLMSAVWSIPNVRHSNAGGVVVSAADAAIEFICVNSLTGNDAYMQPIKRPFVALEMTSLLFELIHMCYILKYIGSRHLETVSIK